MHKAKRQLRAALAESQYAAVVKADPLHPKAYAAEAQERDAAVAAARRASHKALQLQGAVEQAHLERARQRRDRREARAAKRAQAEYDAVEKQAEGAVSSLAGEMSKLALAVKKAGEDGSSVQDKVQQEHVVVQRLGAALEKAHGPKHTLLAQQLALAKAQETMTASRAKYTAAKQLVHAYRSDAKPQDVERAIGIEKETRAQWEDAKARLRDVKKLLAETQDLEGEAERRGEEKVLQALHKQRSDVKGLGPEPDLSSESSKENTRGLEAGDGKDAEMERGWNQDVQTALDKSDTKPSGNIDTTPMSTSR